MNLLLITCIETKMNSLNIPVEFEPLKEYVAVKYCVNKLGDGLTLMCYDNNQQACRLLE